MASEHTKSEWNYWMRAHPREHHFAYGPTVVLPGVNIPDNDQDADE